MQITWRELDEHSQCKANNFPCEIAGCSKIVCHGAVETAALTELRCADADAAPVAQFVDLIEQVDNIEAYLERGLFGELDPARQADVERLVGMALLSVGKTSA